MTLYEMKVKVLSLIEEVNPSSELLTDDPDISAKLNDVINQIMFELARTKKLPRYAEIPVTSGDLLSFEGLEGKFGSPIYQLCLVGGVEHSLRAQGTVIKILADGVLEVEVYIYPERITASTKDRAYEFELSDDVLEVMPYGVAADLLKSDVSAEYGSVYAARYEQMKQMLDPRYQLPMITIEGGYQI